MDNRYEGFLYAAYKDKLVIEALLQNSSTHTEAIAFHSQQFAEKLVKEIFVQNSAVPPKTHAVDELLAQAASNKWIELNPEAVRAASNISVHAVAARYADAPDINEGEALQAVANANIISKTIEHAGYNSLKIESSAHYLSDEAAATED